MVDTRFPVSIHIMVSLAYHQHELMNSDQLARVLKTNATFVRKLVAKLAQAGLVESFRGKGGGIRIGRPPGKITLKEIYLASLEEKPLICAPKKPVTKACPVSCSMSEILCEILGGIEGVTQAFLEKTTLEELLGRVDR